MTMCSRMPGEGSEPRKIGDFPALASLAFGETLIGFSDLSRHFRSRHSTERVTEMKMPGEGSEPSISA